MADPVISRQIGKGEEAAAVHTQNRAIELSLLLALPSAFGLMTAAHPLIHGLMQSGHFDAKATDAQAA